MGKEINSDDIVLNNLSPLKMRSFYETQDLIIVSSLSEGGPKCIPEALLCETPVISTNTGFAKDFLHPNLIYNTPEEAVEIIQQIRNGELNLILNSCYQNAWETYNPATYNARYFNIIKKAIWLILHEAAEHINSFL